MTERISSDEAMKYGLRGYKDIVKYNWHGKMIDIKYYLPRDDEVRLIHSVLECCGANDGAGYIIPEFVDLAIRANIVSAYTNIELPDTVDAQHRLLYCSDLYDVVLKNANHTQIENIKRSVELYV